MIVKFAVLWRHWTGDRAVRAVNATNRFSGGAVDQPVFVFVNQSVDAVGAGQDLSGGRKACGGGPSICPEFDDLGPIQGLAQDRSTWRSGFLNLFSPPHVRAPWNNPTPLLL